MTGMELEQKGNMKILALAVLIYITYAYCKVCGYVE